MIELRNVEKYFFKDDPREIHALQDINLTLEDGEFSLLSGASGCGKTTLLNVIGALDTVESGSIYFDGRDITKLSEDERTTLRLEEMGFVFQAYNLVPVLTVEENIGFIMRLRGFSSDKIAKRVLEVAKILEIESKLSFLPNKLSGGQQQRVAVARAVASKPKIILADEPTANLDSKNSHKLIDMMRELNEKEGMTVIFASHDELVRDSVRRIIRLEDGRLV
ncbi:ABC transporter ATP-binding protein [Sulfurovum sp. bin170]|uniref:ABC transporter ATP-binding protein n=1 Tax=Sulfurovum sp. bin170 TaxID=2695268 RepID=UPI0013E098E2|nr:ABC transporter ATP-binding protein [Sulfurovum sp. bin170]NEW61424.1 ABC transporter ATP-binding protein [Sulfurovum sp. bin170]